MVWPWVVVAAIAIGLPGGTWVLTRGLARPSQSPAGPRPKLDRMDRWLYDRYQLPVRDRWRVREAVLHGRELSEPMLRQAAHALATALLTGQVGTMSPKATRMLIGADGVLIVVVLAVALVTGRYAMLAPVITGIPLMALAVRSVKQGRQRVERARRLNQ